MGRSNSIQLAYNTCNSVAFSVFILYLLCRPYNLVTSAGGWLRKQPSPLSLTN